MPLYLLCRLRLSLLLLLQLLLAQRLQRYPCLAVSLITLTDTTSRLATITMVKVLLLMLPLGDLRVARNFLTWSAHILRRTFAPTLSVFLCPVFIRTDRVCRARVIHGCVYTAWQQYRHRYRSGTGKNR